MENRDIIRVRRQELGLTKRALAERIGVSEATVSRWETGHIVSMRQNKVAKLCEVLRINPSIFVESLPPEVAVHAEPIIKYVPRVSSEDGTQTLLEKLFADSPEVLAEVQSISIEGKLKDTNGTYELTPQGEALIKLAIMSAIKEGKEKRVKSIETKLKVSDLTDG